MVQGVEIVDGHLVSMDPATGAEVGRVRVSTPEQVDHAVEAAKAAQPAWEAVPLPVRVNILKEAVARLRAHANLARLITQEMGKILPEAEGEVYGALDKDRLLELKIDQDHEGARQTLQKFLGMKVTWEVHNASSRRRRGRCGTRPAPRCSPSSACPPCRSRWCPRRMRCA